MFSRCNCWFGELLWNAASGVIGIGTKSPWKLCVVIAIACVCVVPSAFVAMAIARNCTGVRSLKGNGSSGRCTACGDCPGLCIIGSCEGIGMETALVFGGGGNDGCCGGGGSAAELCCSGSAKGIITCIYHSAAQRPLTRVNGILYNRSVIPSEYIVRNPLAFRVAQFCITNRITCAKCQSE